MVYVLTHCVSCGRKLELNSKGDITHKCRASHEKAKKASNRYYNGQSPSLNERLTTGFKMLGE